MNQNQYPQPPQQPIESANSVESLHAGRGELLQANSPVSFDVQNLEVSSVEHDENQAFGVIGHIQAGNAELKLIAPLDKDNKPQASGLLLAGKDFSFSQPKEEQGPLAAIVPFEEFVDYGRSQEGAKLLESRLVSRNHFGIRLGVDGKLEIKDNGSTNGTSVSFTEKLPNTESMRTPEQAADIGGVAVGSEVALAEEKVTAEGLAKKIEELTKGLSEDDKLNLWRYSTGILNKRDAQKRGDGNESTYQGQVSGQGYRDMSQAAKEIANQYHALFSAKDRLHT